MSQFLDDRTLTFSSATSSPSVNSVSSRYASHSPARKKYHPNLDGEGSVGAAHIDRLRSLSFTYTGVNNNNNYVTAGNNTKVPPRPPSRTSRSNTIADPNPNSNPSDVKKSLSLTEINEKLTPSGIYISSSVSDDVSVSDDGQTDKKSHPPLTMDSNSDYTTSKQQPQTAKRGSAVAAAATTTAGTAAAAVPLSSLAGATIAFESLRKIRLYLGLDESRLSVMQDMGIDWQLKVTKPNLNIFVTMIANNSWQAIKAGLRKWPSIVASIIFCGFYCSDDNEDSG